MVSGIFSEIPEEMHRNMSAKRIYTSRYLFINQQLKTFLNTKFTYLQYYPDTF